MTRSSLASSAPARRSRRPAASASRKARKLPAARSQSPSLQRLAARRLLQAASRSDDHVAAARRSAEQLGRWGGAGERRRALSRLRAALALATALQLKWETLRLGVRRSSRRQVDAAARAMDGRRLRLRLRLSRPCRIDSRALGLLHQAQELAERAADALQRHRKLEIEPADAVVDLTGEPNPIFRIPVAPLLPQMRMPREHVPWFLWRVYADSFWNPSATDRLRLAMQEVIVAIRDVNPYFFLKTIHRPSVRPGSAQESIRLRKSKSVKAVVGDLVPLFTELHKRGRALASSDGNTRFRKGWCELRPTLQLVRRLALHFHLVMLHLYAKAMKDPAISQSAIEPLIADAQKMDDRLRDTLALSKECATSPEHLIRDTYEYAPELLVFLDVWRHQPHWHSDPDVATRYGYGPHEHFQAFLPVFDDHKMPPNGLDAVRELGCEINEIHNAWNQSELATLTSKRISLESLGSIEKTIKHRIRGVFDLTYKITLARWIELRMYSDQAEWWRNLTLREDPMATRVEPKEKQEEYHDSSETESEFTDEGDGGQLEAPISQDQPLAMQIEEQQPQAVVEEESAPAVVAAAAAAASEEETQSNAPPTEDNRRRRMVLSVDTTQDDGGFRSPASLKHREWLDSVRPKPTSNSPPSSIIPRKPSTGIVLLEDVYEWSDIEIDQHEREMDHICEVRNELLRLRESLLPAKLESRAAQCMGDHWIEPLELSDVWSEGPCLEDSDSLSLAAVCVHARALSETVAASGEEISMHEAAEALIKNPALRALTGDPVEEDASLVDDDNCDTDVSSSSHQQIDAVEAVRMLQEQFRGMAGVECSRKRGAARLANAALSSLTLVQLLNETLARQHAGWQQKEEHVEEGGATLDVTVDAA